MLSLLQVLNEGGSEVTVNHTEIKAVFKEIKQISKLPREFSCIKKLHLSHNKISCLTGIDQFKNLESLSLIFNKILKIDELFKINRPPKLTNLNVYGNPFTRNPNYLKILITIFPTLTKIDDFDIPTDLHTDYKIIYEKLSKTLIPFQVFFQRDVEVLQSLLDKLKTNQYFRNPDLDFNIENAVASYLNEILAYENAEFGYINRKSFKAGEFVDNIEHVIQVMIYIRKVIQKQSLFNSENEKYRMCSEVLKTLINMIKPYTDEFKDVEFTSPDILTKFYKDLFRDMLLRYADEKDSSLESHLKESWLSKMKGPNENDQQEKFNSSPEFGFDQLIDEFHALWPNLPLFSENYIMNNEELANRRKDYLNEEVNKAEDENIRIWDQEKVYDPLRKNHSHQSSKSVSYKNHQLSQVREKDLRLLLHFPIFQQNFTYLTRLFKLLEHKFSELYNLYQQCFYQIELYKEEQVKRKLEKENELREKIKAEIKSRQNFGKKGKDLQWDKIVDPTATQGEKILFNQYRMGQTSQEQKQDVFNTIPNQENNNELGETDNTINKWQNRDNSILKNKLIDSSNLTENQSNIITKLSNNIDNFLNRTDQFYIKLFFEEFVYQHNAKILNKKLRRIIYDPVHYYINKKELLQQGFNNIRRYHIKYIRDKTIKNFHLATVMKVWKKIALKSSLLKNIRNKSLKSISFSGFKYYTKNKLTKKLNVCTKLVKRLDLNFRYFWLLLKHGSLKKNSWHKLNSIIEKLQKDEKSNKEAQKKMSDKITEGINKKKLANKQNPRTNKNIVDDTIKGYKKMNRVVDNLDVKFYKDRIKNPVLASDLEIHDYLRSKLGVNSDADLINLAMNKPKYNERKSWDNVNRDIYYNGSKYDNDQLEEQKEVRKNYFDLEKMLDPYYIHRIYEDKKGYKDLIRKVNQNPQLYDGNIEKLDRILMANKRKPSNDSKSKAAKNHSNIKKDVIIVKNCLAI